MDELCPSCGEALGADMVRCFCGQEISADELSVKTLKGEVVSLRKSPTIAYVLLFTLGTVGMHRFYVEKPRSGLTLGALNITGIACSLTSVFSSGYTRSVDQFTVFGYGALALGGLWLLFDIIALDTYVARCNKD